MYRLSVFGGLQLQDEAGNFVKLNTRKTQLLLAFLMLNPNVDHSRERLIDLFWTDSPLDKADNSLRQAIHAIRPVVEPEGTAQDSVLWVKQGIVRLKSGENIWFDARVFEDQIKKSQRLSGEQKAAALKEAISLYHGDLLEGTYDDWCLEAQESFRSLYLQALGDLVAHFTQVKAYETAINYARESLAKAPLQEEMHRQLMYLYHASGERGAAIQQFHQCKQLLEEELGAAPSPETEALLQEIKSRSAARKIESIAEKAQKLLQRFPPLGAAFVDRDVELIAFTKTLIQVQQGASKALFLCGEAGIGKTRLAQECLEYASKQGFWVIKGRSYQSEGNLPYQALIDAVRSGLPQLSKKHLDHISPLWLKEVAKWVPELAELAPKQEVGSPAVSPEQERNRIFESFLQFFTGLSKDRPLVLFLDDLQWGDLSTLQFIPYFIRHLAQAKVLALGAFREEEVREDHPFWDALKQLVKDRLAEQLYLHPLNEEEIDELVGGMLNSKGIARLSEQIYADSKGLPFFAEEMVKSYVEHGVLTLNDENQWALKEVKRPAPTLSSSIRALVESRLRHLSLMGRELLEQAAAVGREFTSQLVGRILGALDRDVQRSLEELSRAGFIEALEGSYQFRHDLARQVVYEGLLPERKRFIHAKVGQVLEAQYGQVSDGAAVDSRVIGELARHHVEAHQWAKALAYCLKAGWQVWRQSYAKEEALHYFRQALGIAERLEDENGLMQSYKGLGEVCAFCDEHGGLEYCQNALQLCQEPQCRAEILCAIANVYQLNKNLEGGMPFLQSALNELEGQEESLTLVRTLYHVSNYCNWMQNPEKAVNHCERAMVVLEKLRDKSWQALIQSELGHAYSRLGKFDLAIDSLANAVSIGETIGDQHASKQALFHLGRAYFHTKQPSKAIAEWKKALHICQLSRHSSNDMAAISNWIAKGYMALGRLDDALSFAKACLENDLISNIDVNVASAYISVGCLHDAMNSPIQAADAFKEALKRAPTSGTVYQIAIENYLLLNKLNRAIEWLERGKSFLPRLRLEGLSRWPKYTDAAEKFAAHSKFKSLCKRHGEEK